MSQISASLVKDLRDKSGAGMMDCKKALSESGGDFDAAVDWLRTKGLAAAQKKSGRVASDGLVAVSMGAGVGAMVEVNSETDFVARNDMFQDFASSCALLALDCADVADLSGKAYGDSGHSVEAELTQLVATIGENIQLRRLASVSGEHVASYVHGAVRDGLGKIAVLVGLSNCSDSEQAQSLGKGLAMHIAAARPQFLRIEDIDAETLQRERAILVEQAQQSGKPADVIEKMVEGRLRKFYQESVLLEQTYVVDGESVINKLLGDIEIVGFMRFELGEGLDKREEDFAREVASVAQSA